MLCRVYYSDLLNNISTIFESSQGIILSFTLITAPSIYRRHVSDSNLALLNDYRKYANHKLSLFNIFNDTQAEYIQHLIICLSETFKIQKTMHASYREGTTSIYEDKRKIWISKNHFKEILQAYSLSPASIRIQIIEHAPEVFEYIRLIDSVTIPALLAAFTFENNERSIRLNASK
jgi:hypothetical protein